MILLLLACTGPSDKTPDLDEPGTDSGAPDSGEAAFDPVSLAALVSQDELGATIGALADFGTRHLEADNHDAVRAYLVDRFEALGLEVETDTFTADGWPACNVIARLDGADPSRRLDLPSALRQHL